jgi:ferritin-like metal-binding protein YciE
MPDSETPTADAKLVQYLGEAYSKERELERSLQAHIGMTTRKPYQKRLKEHLRETKNHAKLVERRIKQLGGGGTLATLAKEGPAVAKQATALAKGQLHAARGLVPGMGDEDELMLKNAKTEFSEEHEEIATYRAIEVLAEEVGDKETAKLAKQIRREEEKMASFIERQIPVLTKAVAKSEIPAAERSSGRRRGGSSRRRSSGAGSASSKRSSGSSSRKSGGASSSRKRASASSGRKRTGSSSSRKRSGSSSSSKRTSASSSSKRSSSSSSRKSGSASSSRRKSGSRS